MQEFEGIAIKKINSIPYVLGAKAIKDVFERFGIKKSKKAVYKFISKTPWKKRIKENGKSLIGVPIYEIKRWIDNNYPMISQSEEKNYISKNFTIIDGFQKIIDDISSKIEETESTPEIFKPQEQKKNEEAENKSENQSNQNINPNEKLSELSQEIISLLVKNPPSAYDENILRELKNKLIFIYTYVENILKLKELE